MLKLRTIKLEEQQKTKLLLADNLVDLVWCTAFMFSQGCRGEAGPENKGGWFNQWFGTKKISWDNGIAGFEGGGDAKGDNWIQSTVDQVWCSIPVLKDIDKSCEARN